MQLKNKTPNIHSVEIIGNLKNVFNMVRTSSFTQMVLGLNAMEQKLFVESFRPCLCKAIRHKLNYHGLQWK